MIAGIDRSSVPVRAATRMSCRGGEPRHGGLADKHEGRLGVGRSEEKCMCVCYRCTRECFRLIVVGCYALHAESYGGHAVPENKSATYLRVQLPRGHTLGGYSPVNTKITRLTMPEVDERVVKSQARRLPVLSSSQTDPSQ